MKSILFLTACSFCLTLGVFAESEADAQEILIEETEVFSCSRCKSLYQTNEENTLVKCNCGDKTKTILSCGCKGKPKENKDPIVKTEEAIG